MFGDVLYEALFIAVALYLVSNLYVIFAISRVIAFGRYSDYSEATEQSVTVLIPIRGLGDGLYDNLCSICCQEYSDYQLVPVRDVLGFLVWSASFLGHDVTWKDQTFSVDRTGRLLTKGSGPRACHGSAVAGVIPPLV